MLKRGYAIAAACLAAAVAATAFTPNGKSPTFAAQTHRHPNAILQLGLQGGIESMSAHIIASIGPIFHLRHILCHSFVFVPVK